MAPTWNLNRRRFLILLIPLVSSSSLTTISEKVNDLVNFKSIERIESSNLKKASNLVIDSNPKTCLRVVSPQKNDPRWIKLHFKQPHIFQNLNVTVADRKSNISIFIVVELPSNRTKFSRCALRSNSSSHLNQTHFDFHCPGTGLRGRKIFVRDDEKDANAFYLCEVQAYGIPFQANDCSFRPSIANGVAEFHPNKSRLSFICKDGFVLWGRRHMTCRRGMWVGRPPTCRPLTCNIPQESGSEDTVFKLPRNISTIQLGDEVSVHCREGLLLITNSTEGTVVKEQIPAICSRVGTWEIKTSFNCVNSSAVSPSLLWTQVTTFSIIHTVTIGLSLFLLLILLALTLFLYKRSPVSQQEDEEPVKGPEPLSDRDTSTTTIYDEEIQIPDSGSLIRGPPVDDASIIREDCLIDKSALLFRPKPLSTFKPNQNAALILNNPTNYCVAWTQSHTFTPSDESGLENASMTERSSISCLQERDISGHIYANVNDNHPGYASILPRPSPNEAIYANDPPIKKHIEHFDYSQFQSL